MDKEIRKLLDSLENRDVDKDRDFLEQSLKASFVEDICRILKEKGISQADFARKLGKSRQYVSRILNETANFTLGTLVDISLALDSEIVLRLEERVKSSKTDTVNESLSQITDIPLSNAFSFDEASYVGSLPSSKTKQRLNRKKFVA